MGMCSEGQRGTPALFGFYEGVGNYSCAGFQYNEVDAGGQSGGVKWDRMAAGAPDFVG